MTVSDKLPLAGIRVIDVSTFIAVALAIVTAALVSTYLPARRARRIDPLAALRWE